MSHTPPSKNKDEVKSMRNARICVLSFKNRKIAALLSCLFLIFDKKDAQGRDCTGIALSRVFPKTKRKLNHALRACQAVRAATSGIF